MKLNMTVSFNTNRGIWACGKDLPGAYRVASNSLAGPLITHGPSEILDGCLATTVRRNVRLRKERCNGCKVNDFPGSVEPKQLSSKFLNCQVCPSKIDGHNLG